MIPLIDFPDLVKTYSLPLQTVFSSGEFKQFQRYLSGLIVSENKTVQGINRLFILDLQDQSTLNRFLTASNFKVADLNAARLNWLQSCAQTQFDLKRGVLTLDDTLLTHYGGAFEKVSWLYDHVNKNYSWAHHLVNLHYSDDQTDYPIDFRLWEPADLEQVEQSILAQGYELAAHQLENKVQNKKKWQRYLLERYNKLRWHPTRGKTIEPVYKTKVDYALELIDSFFTRYPYDIPVAFDPWYTCKRICKHIDQVHGKAYVGTLEAKDKILIGAKQVPISCSDFVEQLRQKHHEALANGEQGLFRKVGIPYKGKKEQYYAYCKTHRVKNFGRQRLVICFEKEDLSDTEPKYYISNRLNWNSNGILRIRRHRWPIEVYHQEGKAEGLDKYQLRKFEAVKKHIACVTVAYSMLKRVQFDEAFLGKQQWKPDRKDRSLAFWRRVITANSLIQLIQWAAAGKLIQDSIITKLAAAFT